MFIGAGLYNITTSSATVRDRDNDPWDEYRPRRLKGFKDGGNETDPKGNEEVCSTSSLMVEVTDLDLVPTLAANVTSEAKDTRVSYIDWSLTEATRAVQKHELRRQALATLQAKGKDYAVAFGVEDITLIEFEEMYEQEYTTPQGKRRNRMYWYDNEEADVSVPDVKLEMEVSAKFTV